MTLEDNKMWYIYRHIRLDKNEPFYIGIGKVYPADKKSKKDEYFYRRAFIKSDDKRSKFWIRVTEKSEYKVEILLENLTKEEASKKETEFISLYGRKDLGKGTLVNMTDGGDGVFGRLWTEEQRKKQSESKMGEKNPMYGKKQSPELINKRMALIKGRIITDEERRNHQLATIKSGQAKAVLVFTFEDFSYVGEYITMSEAARQLGVSNSKVSQVCNGQRKQTGGFVFRCKYIES